MSPLLTLYSDRRAGRLEIFQVQFKVWCKYVQFIPRIIFTLCTLCFSNGLVPPDFANTIKSVCVRIGIGTQIHYEYMNYFCMSKPKYINSPSLNDAYMRQYDIPSWSQIMATLIYGTRHWPTQCWCIINAPQIIRDQWNLNHNGIVFTL